MANEFYKISRWLYQSDDYAVSSVTTSPHGRWKVARRDSASTIGFAGTLEDAILLAEADRILQASGKLPPMIDYLTNGHERDIMVLEAMDDERTASMTDTPVFNTCKCYSHYSEVEVDGEVTRVHRSCGATIPRKRTFSPGHDAKFKSVLLWAFREGVRFTYELEGVTYHGDPVKLADERGWGKFMTPKPKKVSKAKAEGKDNSGVDHADDVDDTFDEGYGVRQVEGFHPASVKVGRWWKDGHVVAETDEQVTVRVMDKNGSNPKDHTFDRDSDRLELG